MRIRAFSIVATIVVGVSACGTNPVASDRAAGSVQKRMDQTCTPPAPGTTCVAGGGGLYGSGY